LLHKTPNAKWWRAPRESLLSPAQDIKWRRVVGWLAIMAWLFASPVSAGVYEFCYGTDRHSGIETVHEAHGTISPSEMPSLSQGIGCFDKALILPNAPEAQPLSLPRPVGLGVSVDWPPPNPALTGDQLAIHGAGISPPPMALLVRDVTILLI